jgi:hypothetical protein
MSYILHYHQVREGQEHTPVLTVVNAARDLEHLVLFLSRLNHSAFEYGVVYYLTQEDLDQNYESGVLLK